MVRLRSMKNPSVTTQCYTSVSIFHLIIFYSTDSNFVTSSTEHWGSCRYSRLQGPGPGVSPGRRAWSGGREEWGEDARVLHTQSFANLKSQCTKNVHSYVPRYERIGINACCGCGAVTKEQTRLVFLSPVYMYVQMYDVYVDFCSNRQFAVTWK